MRRVWLVLTALVFALLGLAGCDKGPKEVERPERILSKRQVLYDSSTYAKLARLWKEYYEAYPCEDAYANWMYAARYASDAEYPKLLQRGLEAYPFNPGLLYLAGNEKSSKQDNLEGLHLLERSAALDPQYMDPWFSLVGAYLSQGEREKSNAALRQLLAGGAIDDAVMDFNYNMIACMDTGGILITNGDNDTYPGWILTRIGHFRSDVNIVNRSLLNTKWYPSVVVEEGVPQFITSAGSDSLLAEFAADVKRAKIGLIGEDQVLLVGDRLIIRIIEAARRAERPVYFACTLYPNVMVNSYRAEGQNLGLLTRVTPTLQPYRLQVRRMFQTWADNFRVGGLDSWGLHAAKETRAGKMLVRNYAGALQSLKSEIEIAGPAIQLSLFRWYRDHLVSVLPVEESSETNSMWCNENSPEEIRKWCKALGLVE